MHLHRGNLYLVGLPGAGKSTLGRQLARRLSKTFVDADAELERKLGVTIPTIFEIEGEASFRDREEAVLAELTVLSNVVLDELDWELDRRGHRFARYADDANIVVPCRSSRK